MHTKAGQEAWRSMLDVLFSGQVHGRMQQACTTLGVPPGVLKLLMQLRPGVGVPMRELAEHFGFDASYLAFLLQRLPVEVGRFVLIPQAIAVEVEDRSASPAISMDERVGGTGRRIMDTEPPRDRAYQVIYDAPPSFGSLTAAEQRQLRDLLRKVVDADPDLALTRPAAVR